MSGSGKFRALGELIKENILFHYSINQRGRQTRLLLVFEMVKLRYVPIEGRMVLLFLNRNWLSNGIDVGDLIVHGMDGFAGAIGISDSRGKATPVLNVLNTTECKKYIMYLMRSMAYCGLFLSLSTGIRVRTCDTNWKKLREIDYLLPDLLEQQNIANFLVAKCAEIDALAADIQTQIDTLEQYKRSVITEAITKGLNPDVEMACHQISWIEQMPAHWKIIPSKYLFHNSDKRKCEGDQQLTASQKHGIITQQEYMDVKILKLFLPIRG